jgi:hypothetical protein
MAPGLFIANLKSESEGMTDGSDGPGVRDVEISQLAVKGYGRKKVLIVMSSCRLSRGSGENETSETLLIRPSAQA